MGVTTSGGCGKIAKFCQNCRKKQMNYKELFIPIYVNEQYIYRVSKIWFTATCKQIFMAIQSLCSGEWIKFKYFSRAQ